mgnify:CR=1 FL=1
MKFIELMQRAGIKDFGVAKSYFKTGLTEMESIVADKIKMSGSTITKSQRYYSLPTDMIDLKSVMTYDADKKKYIKVPRLKEISSVDTDNDA